MSKSKRNERELYHPPSPPRWKGRDSLDLAHQLNERCLKLLHGMSTKSDANNWPLIAYDPALWSRLDAKAMARAARFPFVILDVRFTDETWWRNVIDGGDVGAAPHDWPADIAGELMQETLIFAWHTAKWDRRVARLSLGMLPAVAESMAALTPRQLADVSARHSGALRVRWQEQPDFWTRLLVAAIDSDEETLSEIHLHAKLLLSGELLARSALQRVST
jgi:hypothetical protein